jgi:serine/threonine protein phosphatase PrpC
MLGEGLMPGGSDAAWIAQFGARRLMAHLGESEGARKALRATLADTQKSFEALRRHPPAEMWQTPCASLMLALRNDDGLELLWFGDCAALIKQEDGSVMVMGETLDKRAAEAERARKVAKERNAAPASALSRPDFVDVLRAARNRINSGNNWLFSPDIRAASHVSRRVVKVRPGSTLLLASDGFLALVSDYGAYGADGLMVAAMEKGLAALGEELRAIESGDEGGDKFPRFKKSDDATALLLRVN